MWAQHVSHRCTSPASKRPRKVGLWRLGRENAVDRAVEFPFAGECFAPVAGLHMVRHSGIEYRSPPIERSRPTGIHLRNFVAARDGVCLLQPRDRSGSTAGNSRGAAAFARLGRTSWARRTAIRSADVGERNAGRASISSGILADLDDPQTCAARARVADISGTGVAAAVAAVTGAAHPSGRRDFGQWLRRI